MNCAERIQTHKDLHRHGAHVQGSETDGGRKDDCRRTCFELDGRCVYLIDSDDLVYPAGTLPVYMFRARAAIAQPKGRI
jgi:hypothetical protein